LRLLNGGWSAAVLVRTLPSLPSLTRLGVSSNFFTPSSSAVRRAAHARGTARHEQHRLFNADVATDFVAVLSSALRQLLNSLYLDMGVTSLSDDGLRTMMSSIAWTVLLEEVHLPDMKWYYYSPEAVAALVCALPAHHRLRRMSREGEGHNHISGMHKSPAPIFVETARASKRRRSKVRRSEHVHAAPRHVCIDATFMGKAGLWQRMMRVDLLP
jgi:hypothetical protein